MIIGTGIDMVEVDRIAERINGSSGFKEKVFAKAEIRFCDSKQNKAEHYAARFAAKEAFLKATGLGLLAGLALSDIEIYSDAHGKPGIKLHGDFQKQATENNWTKIHVSLSHTTTMACASVIIEQ